MPTPQELIDQAYSRITGASPSPTPSVSPSAVPVSSASPGEDPMALVDEAYNQLRGGPPGTAIGSAASAAPMATPLPTRTPLPSPAGTPEEESPTPTPLPTLTPHTDKAIEGAGSTLSEDLSMFSRKMGQAVDPTSLFRKESWFPDTEAFPGVLTPLYHPPRVVAGEADVYPVPPGGTPHPADVMLRGAPHKANVWEASAMNLANGFISGASSLHGLVGFLPPIFIAETLTSLPQLWNTLKESQKYPPLSQERIEAVLGLVATLATMGFMRKSAVNSVARVNQAFREGFPAPPSLRAGPEQLPPVNPIVQEQPGEKGFVTIRPGFQRVEPQKQEDVGPVIEQEVPSAEQQSVPQVQTGPTALGVEERPSGAGQGPGDSDLSVGTAQGEAPGRQVPPVRVPGVPKVEEKKQEPESVEAKAVEDLTDPELNAAIDKAREDFKAGRSQPSEVFDLLDELRRRQEEKTKPKPTPGLRTPPPKREEKPTEEQLKIDSLQGEASDLQNQLSKFKDQPMTDEVHALQEKLWDTFNRIHALREASGQPRDFVIIGGGAAGLKAAGQAAYEGVDTVVLEKSPTPGGQAKRSLEIVNTGAEPFGTTGRNYFRQRELTALNRGADVRTGVEVVDLKERPDGGVDVITKGGGIIPARRVAVLTGAKPELHPGFEYAGWGNAERFARLSKGKVGMVYGAGNSATQAVLGAIDRGAKKVILMSRHDFGPEASTDQVLRIKQLAKDKNPKVEIVTAEIKNVKPNPDGGFIVTASNGKNYKVAHLENFLDTSFNTSWLPQQIERAPIPEKPLKPGQKPRPPKPAQIKVTDNSMQTSMPGVYVGGDIRASLPGEYRPRRIDMAEGDAAGIAARVHRDVLYERNYGEFPEWKGETPEETQAIDTRLKELKDAEHNVTDWEGEHGDATPNAEMPPPPRRAPTAPFPEPQPEARFYPARPGFEGPMEKQLSPEARRKISEGSRAITQKAAEHAAKTAADTATTGTQTQQEQRKIPPHRGLYSPELVDEQASAKVKANMDYPDMVLTGLVNGERGPLNPVDSTVVLRERAVRQGQMNAAGKRAMDTTLSPGERHEAMANYTEQDNHIRLMDDATDQGRLLSSEESRAWHDYRMKDYSLPAMETKLQIAQAGKPLSAGQLSTLQKQTDKLAKAEAQVEALKTRIGFRIGQPMTSPHRQALRDLQYEAHNAKVDLDNAIFDARFKERTAMYRFMTRAGQTMDLARSVMTSGDFSAVLRQGGLFARGHPIMTLKEIPDMLRAAKSDKAYFELMQDIRERPNAGMYVSSKLGLTDVKSPEFSRMEEAYGSQWADKIPVVGYSQRAYVYFLNRMRADMFDYMAERLPINGVPSPTQAHAISNFINTFTGRGRTPAQLSGAMHLLNEAFFAPRYTISRFQVLYGDPLWVAKNAAGVRKLIAMEYARTLTGYLAEYALAYYALKPLGVSIEFDPRSNDWMSIKIGDTRWNPLAGLTSPAVFAARSGAAFLESLGLIEGSYKAPSGEIRSLRNPKYGARLWGDILRDFGRSKLAPMPGMVWNGLEGQKVTGEPTTWSKELLGLMYPITVNDVYHSMAAWGIPVGLGLSLAAIFGDSVNTYATKPGAGVRTKKPHPKGRKRN